MTQRITAEHLHGIFAALGTQERQLFQRIFPDGMPLTEDAMAVAAKAGLDVFCFDELLTDGRRSTYQAARRQALETSHAATQPLWEAFKQASENDPAAKQQALEPFLAAKQQADEAQTAATLLALLAALREEIAR